MRKFRISIIALLTAVSMLLSGCMLVGLSDVYDILQALEDVEPVPEGISTDDYIHFEDMEYVRPDMDMIQQSYDALCETAQGSDMDAIVDAIEVFYADYDWFYTYYNLADIHYCQDMTDTYWETEYNFCAENAPTVDAMLEEMYYVLAKSPCRKQLEGKMYFGAGFFDAYDGENQWDETFTAMLEEEARLQSRYYELTDAANAYQQGSEAYYDAYADEMAQVMVDLIALRQEMAAYWGYTDYDQFAWDFYYYRDYTPAQMEAYLQQIQTELVPLYRRLDGSLWNSAYRYSSQRQTMDYVREMAQNMGGTVEEAFSLMENAGLYDISSSPNKYDASFELFLVSYGEPYIFLNSIGSVYDCLTLAHEFGHFCNDYASYGSYVGIDVLEVFSQAMEFLSLRYVEDDRGLTEVKMADSLCTYVEQSAYASFEQQAYRLTGDALTVENLYALFSQVMLDFGIEDTDGRYFVTIPHFFTNPMYIISYVVSNDAAIQFYQLEMDEPGEGLARLEENLDTEEDYFLEFVESAGLESPFAPGRLESVRDMFEEFLD